MSEVDYIGRLIAVDGGEFEHAGVKGMKWGVRKDPGHAGEKTKTKKIAKIDKKFEKSINNLNSGKSNVAMHNAFVSRLNAASTHFADNNKWRDINIDSAPKKVQDAYAKACTDLIVKSMEDATRAVYGSNASGTKKGVYNPKTDRIDIVDNDVKHSDEPDKIPNMSVLLKRNSTGHVIGYEVVDFVDDELEHAGIKGMKWGVRKDDSSSSTTAKSSNGPESSADRYTRLLSQAKKDGANTFSEEDLRFVTQRGNAINQVERLNSTKPNWVADAAKQALKQAATQTVKVALANATKKYISNQLGK